MTGAQLPHRHHTRRLRLCRPPISLSLSLRRGEPKHCSLSQVEFKPLVQLDEVKTASGEEEEEVLFKM